jgi:hypothetical protein
LAPQARSPRLSARNLRKDEKFLFFWHFIKPHCPQGRGQPVPP